MDNRRQTPTNRGGRGRGRGSGRVRGRMSNEPPVFRHNRNRWDAEAAYAEDPLDVDNLTGWGTALLELASLDRPRCARKMLRDAISKFEEALGIDPTKYQTHWCLGRAFTALALLSPHVEDARNYLTKATNHFTKACMSEPDNRLYRESLEMASVHFTATSEWKPGYGLYGLYDESVEMAAKKCTELAAPKKEKSSALKHGAATRKEKSSDVKYGIMGLVSAVVAIVAWVGFSMKQMPLLPPRRTPRG